MDFVFLASRAGARGFTTFARPGRRRAARCNTKVYTDQQVAQLAKLPILVVFGDHLDAPQVYGSPWQVPYDDCKAFIERVNAAGGNARMLYPRTSASEATPT